MSPASRFVVHIRVGTGNNWQNDDFHQLPPRISNYILVIQNIQGGN